MIRYRRMKNVDRERSSRRCQRHPSVAGDRARHRSAPTRMGLGAVQECRPRSCAPIAAKLQPRRNRLGRFQRSRHAAGYSLFQFRSQINHYGLIRLGGAIAQGNSSFFGAGQGCLLAPDHGCAARFLSVYLDPHQLVFRKIRAFADCMNRACWNASTAIDACYRINVHALIVAMETRHRTGKNAIRESAVVTVSSNHMWHCRSSFKHRGGCRLAARRGHVS